MNVHDPAAKLRPLNLRPSTSEYLSELWRRRDFAIAMPAEQLRASHQNTLLGNIWHLGNPLLTVVVSYVVFGVVLGTDRGVENFTLWLTVGVFAFGLTSSTVQGGARSISTNQGLMRSIRFPRAVLPVSEVLSELFAFMFQLVILGVVALMTGEGVSQRWVVLPAVVVVHSAFNLGGAFIAARLNDSFRDVQRVIPYMFRLLTFVSGVMIPVSAVRRDRSRSSRPATVHQEQPVAPHPGDVPLGVPRRPDAGRRRDPARPGVGGAARRRLLVLPRRRVAVREELMADLTIRVRDLHVIYELHENRRAAIRDRVVSRRGTGRSEVHAVKGVSFDVFEGDAVGIVGSNGSGKSTMLSAIAGMLPPASGEILVLDEPKLLGVNAMLLPAATGWRNIRLGCLALGLTSVEVDERIDEIAAFCDLGEALDRPLRTYSSGMKARLHFAIATAVQPRILFIDEALGVGDRRFRRKAQQRLRQLVASAGTMMLVTHSTNEIRAQCNARVVARRGCAPRRRRSRRGRRRLRGVHGLRRLTQLQPAARRLRGWPRRRPRRTRRCRARRRRRRRDVAQWSRRCRTR